MSTAELQRAFDATRAVLENVKPDQMDDDTPCESWKVKDLVNHIVQGALWFGASMDAGESQPFDDAPDYSAMDYMKLFDDGVKNSVEAFGRDGAAEKNVKLPFGEFPGAAFMGLATTDTFVHGWDLAKATGQDTNLDPELAKGVLEGSKANIQPEFRGPDTKAPFGPECDAPPDASMADQLAAFLGRTV
jgi:uncharacterized protein (TIGR03086 family)